MDLFGAATYFDTDVFTDAYTGAVLFTAQVSSFDDSSSDGATNRRRVLSTGPNVVMPARNAVVVDGERWLVGSGTSDGFAGDVIRKHFTMKRATDMMAVLTPGQALAASAGVVAYVQKMYFRDDVNTVTDSEYDAQWNIFISPGEPGGKGTFLRDAAGRLYRVRNAYLPTEGLRILQADELELTALQACTFDTGAWNPVTEKHAVGTSVVNCIVVDTPKFYRFRHVSDERILPGDMALYVPSSLTLKQGTTFTMFGARWRAMEVQPEMDAQVAHVRRA